MTSLCSDASSSVSSRRRQQKDDTAWERMKDEFQKRKEKCSVFSASPWDREEKEKLQREQLLDARRARDQEIAYWESMTDRTEKQEEWLRILRLEREFQRRAEQELQDDDDEDEEETESTQISDAVCEKIESSYGDQQPVNSDEKTMLKLLDDLEKPSKNSTSSEKCNGDREQKAQNPSEKHFIPLDVSIPDRDILQPSSAHLGNNILQISSEHNADHSGNRLSKPPVPAPRPSKAFTAVSPPGNSKPNNNIYNHNTSSNFASEAVNGSSSNNTTDNTSSLTKLEISDSSAYFCSNENASENSRGDTVQENWLIEVNSFEHSNFPDREDVRRPQQSTQNVTSKEETRIYENIKPVEYKSPKTNPNSIKNGFGSHTLPRSTSCGSTLVLQEPVSLRYSTSHFEKKFPCMGVSSTLTKKLNGLSTCDNDTHQALFSSGKPRNDYAKDIPRDLVDKSPEFKKLWISRPEKLTFQDKIRKFSLQAGEEDLPRDRVKNSRAQREIENKFSEGQKRAIASTE
ncbi:hypothetical protein X975_23853, partial [Stegodyphus mimosarum]